MNAAELLLAFFNADLATRKSYRLADLVAAVDAIDQHRRAAAELGEPVAMYLDAVPRWTGPLIGSFRDGNGRATQGFQPQDGDLGLLQAVGSRLRQAEPEVKPNVEDQLRPLLAEVKRAVVDDESLPRTVRMHIATLLLHVESCLDEYAVKGHFALREAIERLLASLRVAEEKSADPNRWTKLWQEWAKPVVLGLAIEVPSIGIGIGQLVQGAH